MTQLDEHKVSRLESEKVPSRRGSKGFIPETNPKAV